MSGLYIKIDMKALKPIVEAACREAFAEYQKLHEYLPDRTFNEAEAAQWLGLNEPVLAAERRRGRISASKIVNRRVRYLKSDLLEYMQRMRVKAK